MVHPGSSAGSEPWKRGLDGSTHPVQGRGRNPASPISLFPYPRICDYYGCRTALHFGLAASLVSD